MKRHSHGDWYVYCDICGKRYLASKTTKLSQYTGKGGLIVCRHDADKVDPGLIPYRIKREEVVPFSRVGYQAAPDAAPLVDVESMAFLKYLTSSQDNVQIVSSQDGAAIITSEAIL